MPECCQKIKWENFFLAKSLVSFAIKDGKAGYLLFYRHEDKCVDLIAEFPTEPDVFRLEAAVHEKMHENLRQREERESWEPKLGID